jgi:CRP-like cAMP-binding protein
MQVENLSMVDSYTATYLPGGSCNTTLQSLIGAGDERLTAELECITLNAGSVVFDDSTPDPHVIFPVDCVLSLRGIMPDGNSSELALVGDDGMVSLNALTGFHPVVSQLHMRWQAMRSGAAWRLPTRTVLDLIDASPAARRAVMANFNRLAWEFIARAQCNRHHRLEEQLCSWLLRFRALAQTDEIACTQQEIADVIGVRRESISDAFGNLRAAGAIGYGRGRLHIVDVQSLAARACCCQRVVDDRLSASIVSPVATKTPDKPTALRRTSE